MRTIRSQWHGCRYILPPVGAAIQNLVALLILFSHPWECYHVAASPTLKKILILQVEIYKGIPFAAPPIGSLRFMPPVTVTPWREIRSATHFGPVCPQILPDTRNETAALSMMSQGRLEAIRDMKPKLANQTEDCLYLNVYSPKSKSGRTWPWPKLIWLIFSFTTLQSHETILYTESNQVLDHLSKTYLDTL